MNLKIDLENLTLEPTSLAIGLGLGVAIGFLVGVLIWFWNKGKLQSENSALKVQLETERASLEDRFTILAQQTLQSNSENFLNIAQEKLKSAQSDGAHALDKRTQAISEMIKPVEKHLQQLNGAVEQLSGTDKAIRDDLKNLSKETARLTGALKNPAAQGRWGEFVLERLLDKANLMKGVHYDTQVSMNGKESGDGRLRPDAVIYLQDGFNIIVDAKAPITEFINRLDEPMDEQSYRELQVNLARSVRSHVKALGAKNYWEQLDSPDFVVLFLPSENLFSTALAADPELVDFAADQNVVIASPTLLMSLLRVVGLSWRQVEMAQNAQEISKLGGELFDRILSFKGHLDKVGKGIESALGAYNKSVGALESRVLVTARKFKDMQGAPVAKEIEQPLHIEGAARPISVADEELIESNNIQEIKSKASND